MYSTLRPLIAVFVTLALTQSLAAAQGPLEARGEALVSQYCAMCHAIGRSDSSPNAQAPPFHILGRNYAIDSLEQPLQEGALFGHPMMPKFVFSGRDAKAIVRYLQSIQDK